MSIINKLLRNNKVSSFEDTFAYKLIYAFEVPNLKDHKWKIKVWDAIIKTSEPIENLKPSCTALNNAAKKRINEYMWTWWVDYTLLYTELAIKEDNWKLKWFRDHDVHRVLENSNIHKEKLWNSKEWFKTDIKTVVAAIQAVKKWESNLSWSKVFNYPPIILRDEQEDAIKLAQKVFKNSNRALWNAKMRFWKTVSALELVKREWFKKAIIVTHRPVVKASWYDDFSKIFNSEDNYIYWFKQEWSKDNWDKEIRRLKKSWKNFVYFASIQDLRESKKVWWKYDKNDEIFDTNWDIVIVDEAHEWTQTILWDTVIKELVKEDSKLLALSWTPFNILEKYEEESVYTWDYIMEQERKMRWAIEHFWDYNPYDPLPKLNIYTYNLWKLLNHNYEDLADKAFSFKEFFRVDENWDFIHKKDIEHFLNLMSKENNENCYPYASKEFRNYFRHSLWMIPWVKEWKALSKMLKNHPVFWSWWFKIVNVAWDWDKDEENEKALEMVQKAIRDAWEDWYTITLSCWRLTTWVTVPERTAVLMLAGSSSTSASNYLQTIFRVQSPCNYLDWRVKTDCYAFDFAPDRTLKMVADAVSISTKAWKATSNDRVSLWEFLNYCPVIAIEGSIMKEYDVNSLMQKLKSAQAERAMRNWFDDKNLYNDELLKLDWIDLEKFDKLKWIIWTSKAEHKTNEIDLNSQWFTDEQYEKIEKAQKKKPKERTPEEQALIDEAKAKNKTKKDAISILRWISIRLPLLVYWVDIPIEEDITIEKLVDKIDEDSWNEFIPKWVTKEIFSWFLKYYDQDIFIAASRRIRNEARAADEEKSVTERVIRIANIFSYFKNPDKETILTPRKVVNMHLWECLWWYSFYEEWYERTLDNTEEHPLRFINNWNITKETLWNPDAVILEINAKTWLYPLYATYSIFKAKCNKESNLTAEKEEKLRKETLENNIFVICKTKMAKYITKRTLAWFKNYQVNAHSFDNLITSLSTKPKQFIERVKNINTFNSKKNWIMKFDAIIWNPPYQELVWNNWGNSSKAKSIYHNFIDVALKLDPKYVSMITPSRWMTKSADWISDEWTNNMINSDKFVLIHDFLDSKSCFNNVDIKWWVNYFLIDNSYDWACKYYLHDDDITLRNEKLNKSVWTRKEDFWIIIRDKMWPDILRKISKDSSFYYTVDEKNFSQFVWTKDFYTNKTVLTSSRSWYSHEKSKKNNIKYYCNKKSIRTIWYIPKDIIPKNIDTIEKHRVYIPAAWWSGNDELILWQPFYGEPFSVCSQTFLVIWYNQNFTEIECKNIIKYIKTKFFRYLVSLKKKTQNGPRMVYQFVPIQNFKNNSDIDRSKKVDEIDKILYKKYKLSDDEIKYIESRIKPLD